MNRSGLVLIGFAVAILGYALIYSGISTLNPCITPTGEPYGVLAAIVPGVPPALGSAGFSSTGGTTTPGGGGAPGGTHTGASLR